MAKLSLTLAGLGAATLSYSLWEARQYTLRRFQLQLGRPTPGGRQLGNLRILHLSDLHLAPRDRDRMAWISGLDALMPDLVVVTGDFHGSLEGGKLALAALEPLLHRPGVFVHGSNDYYHPKPINPTKYFAGPSRVARREPRIDTAILDDGLAAAGWVCLDNASAQLAVAGWQVAARGVADPHIKLDRYDLVAGPYPEDSDLRLGVSHAPYTEVLEAFAADGTDLVLAGHTHGGQVALPFFGALVTNCDLPRPQAKGLSAWSGSALHVSAGLGTNPYTPIRLACRPEATLLTVVPASARQ